MLRKLVRSRAASRLQASLSDSLLGQILYIGYAIYIYIYIYIYIVCNYSQPVAAAVATDIYTYTYIYIYILYTHISIYIYIYQSGLCCTTSPACTLLGYVHGSSAVFCLANVGHAGVADRLHLEVVKQPAKYIVCCRCVPSGDSGQIRQLP
jgi:hypothetical protein